MKRWRSLALGIALAAGGFLLSGPGRADASEGEPLPALDVPTVSESIPTAAAEGEDEALVDEGGPDPADQPDAAEEQPERSLTETLKVSRRPSTRFRVASAVTSAPTFVGCTWSSSTRMPTVVLWGGSWPFNARMVASSHRATTRGVPSTGTSPEPSATDVSPSVTFSSTVPVSPGSTDIGRWRVAAPKGSRTTAGSIAASPPPTGPEETR